MKKQDIIEQVKLDYEIVLQDFRVYNSPMELFYAEKDLGNLSPMTLETSGATVGEEENVFRVGNLWLYSPNWHDVEWDD